MIEKKLLATTALLVFLTACSSVPISSLPKLSKVDFLTTDLDRLRVALTLPSQVKPGKNGVVLSVNYAPTGAAPEQSYIILNETRRDADRVGLPTVTSSQQRTYAYKLETSEAKKFENVRQRIQVAKEKGVKGTLDISVVTKEFCSTGVLPAGPVLTTIYIASVETEGYVVASRNLDLTQEPATAEILKKLQPCQE
jgi:hypothetical protein